MSETGEDEALLENAGPDPEPGDGTDGAGEIGDTADYDIPDVPYEPDEVPDDESEG